MDNAFELIRATRRIELANFCFSGLDNSNRVENKRILLDENKRRLLVEAFIEFIDITFSDEIYDKLINQIEEKIGLELNKKDNLPKKFIVPSEGIYYVDTDFEYLDSLVSLIIDFNWRVDGSTERSMAKKKGKKGKKEKAPQGPVPVTTVQILSRFVYRR